MSFLKRFLMALIDPAYVANQKELTRLRGTTSMRRGWSRTVQGGTTVGFAHLCECGMDVKIVAPLDIFKRYRCNCGATFALLVDVGAVKTAPDKTLECLMRLPVRQGAAPAQRQPAPQIGAWDNSGDTVEWCGSPQR
jgi:hypothetical protein